jgi:seryl-tRNA synthetase
VQSLLQFVKQNKDVLNSNLSEKVDDMFNVDMQLDNDNIDNEEIRQMKNPVTKQVALTLRSLVQRSTAKETQFNQKLQN